MFYKLSNTATLKEIENEFEVTFQFPNLYKPAVVINGLEESTLTLITMDKPKKIGFGIWGLLPKSLEDNWKVFQNITNTLNINIEHLDFKDNLYFEAMNTRRCLVICTGFFTSALYNGKMYPHHVYLEGHTPFAIAGVYNQLEDGFITCSILLKKTNSALREIPHLLEYKPVIFNANDRKRWLNKKFAFDDLLDLVKSHQNLEFRSHPISKEFYDHDIVYDGIIKSRSFTNFLRPSE